MSKRWENFKFLDKLDKLLINIRGGSGAAATFVIILNGFQPLTIITKRSILDVAAALDLSLNIGKTT